ncbi:hypothetical protein K438DRAFT_1725811, partial [Mycena galopus ATCC 62051]
MDSPPSLNVATTIGAYQIGVLISYALLGMTTTQAYIYYSRFPKDPKILKFLVALVWSCEIAHAACIAHTLYTYTVQDYGKPELLNRIPASFVTSIFFTGLVSACVQGFFAYRIYVLSGRWYFLCILWVLSGLRCACAMVIFVAGLRHPESIINLEAEWGWAITTAWGVSVATDLAITGTLVLLLTRQRTNGQKKTVAVVDKIITWTIETGLLTSGCGIIILICFQLMKDNLIWAAAFVISARLFSNSLLASLNSRTTLRGIKAPHSRPALNSTGNVQIEIEMSKATESGYHNDGDF